MNLDLFDGAPATGWRRLSDFMLCPRDLASTGNPGAAPAILAAATALPPNVIEQESIATAAQGAVGRKIRPIAALALDL